MPTQKWIVANSIAVVLAAAVSGAKAQTPASTTPNNAPPTQAAAPTTQAPVTTAPTPAVAPEPTAVAPLSNTTTTWTNSSTTATPVNYKVLLNKPYDYSDLMAAKAMGYDESSIATFANIAERAGVPFNEIVSEVTRGMSYAFIGQKYGLTNAQIQDDLNTVTEIQDFKTAYVGAPPVDTNYFAEAVARRDTSLMARALAPSPLPTLSPIASSSSSGQVASATPPPAVAPIPTPAPVETAEAPPAPMKRPMMAHRTLTKTVRVYAAPIHRRQRYAYIHHHRYNAHLHRRHHSTWRSTRRHWRRHHRY